MKNKIRVYVESLFDGAEKTEEVVELREEILQNVIDKYDDLVADGKNEDEAYRIAVSGIGDINELLRSMGGTSNDEDEFNPYSNENNTNNGTVEKAGKGKTVFLCTAVVLYILSIVPVIIGDELIGTDSAEGIGVCFMFIICAIATGFIIAYVASRPKVGSKAEEAVKKAEENPAVKSINSAIWSVGTVVYFIVSFSTGAWFITWLIFCITDSITEVVKAYFQLKASNEE